MRKLLLGGAAAVLLMGTGAASAQSSQTTTTTTQSPDETTRTTVTNTDNMDGTYTQYKKTVTSTHHFDDGVWTAPEDYRAHHFGVGDRLPGDLMVNDYYLTNYSTFDLVAPPSGTVWVRVGKDAFLVRSVDGEIIQADYGMFL